MGCREGCHGSQTSVGVAGRLLAEQGPAVSGLQGGSAVVPEAQACVSHYWHTTKAHGSSCSAGLGQVLFAVLSCSAKGSTQWAPALTVFRQPCKECMPLDYHLVHFH
jgi:hypothetical protein